MPIQKEWERALLHFEKQQSALSVAFENLHFHPVKKEVEIFVEAPKGM